MSVIEQIAVGIASNVTSTPIIALVKYLKDAIHLEDNLHDFIDDLSRLDEILGDIRTQFEDQQKMVPEGLKKCLERMNSGLGEAKGLIDRAQRQRRRCLGCFLPRNPRLATQISEWRTNNRFQQLLQQLDSDLSRAAHTAQIAESSQPQAELLLQPLPESGFVGSRIEAYQKQLLTWLNDPQARVIAVYGMGGIGKTSLLQLIYNNCQKKVSADFDFVFWFTVSQNYRIESLQNSIAHTLNLKFEENSSCDMRKMKLYAFLEKKRFLLVLDDLWSPIDLDEVGVKFGDHNQSKLLISSRRRDVIGTMGANDYSMRIQPLSTEEGWELFKRRAFTNGAVPDKNMEAIGKEIASECEGLPLAINTVAAALAWKKSVHEWNSALSLMRNADPSFPTTHESIDTKLYQCLRSSYLNLPDHNLKMCFLYCAAFPEDKEIDAETLVEMWTAESLVPQKSTTYFMDVGRKYIDLLVDRCLFEYVDAGKQTVKVHDVLRDLAIHIGQGEEKCLFLSSQHLQHFPSEEETTVRKRISLYNNEISVLPTDMKCPTLVSLVLAENTQLREIPERFWVNFISLKVLDLSGTSIETLPASVGQLRQLEFLNLECCTKLKDLPDSICNLSHLQFLHLGSCGSLNYLPDRIGELKNLKQLIFSYGGQVKLIPHQLCQLSSLNKLVLPIQSTPMSVEDLTNLSNLIELYVKVKPEIKWGSMSTWSEMRRLTLWFQGGEDENREDAGLDILPQNMQSMKKLQSLHLHGYRGVSLPDCICQFQYFKNLNLSGCMKLKELPSGGFPMLEELQLSALNSLESIVWMEGLPNLRHLDISRCNQLKELFMDTDGGFPMLQTLQLRSLERLESIMWNAKTMLQLQILDLAYCRVLKTFKMEELPNLRKLRISACDELFTGSGILERTAVSSSLQSEGKMPKLESLFIDECLFSRRFITKKFPNLKVVKISNCPELEVEIGSLPMLENLILSGLKKTETIAILSSVWNEETMPKLQTIKIIDCPLLRRLPMEMDKLSNLREIVGELDWWEGISWENDNVKIKLSQLFREADLLDYL